MKQICIQPNDAGQRLDKFLTKSFPALPQSMLYKAIRKKLIKRNGKRAALNDRLEPGDVLELWLKDEFLVTEQKHAFLSAPATIDIVYEDENILLVNKPQGLVVHEDNEQTTDTLIHRILHLLYDRGEYRPEEELSFTPALCNRIDRNTCGIVIAAKNAEALRILNEKIKNRELEKEYLCLVAGTPSPKRARLTHYLEKRSDENRVEVYDKPHPNAKTAITDYEVLESKGDLSLVRVLLHTGRTHQIRAQMAAIRHPLLGDGKYGNGELNRRYRLRQQALCSYRLTFRFREDAGLLQYLQDRSFEVASIWFVDRFHQGMKR